MQAGQGTNPPAYLLVTCAPLGTVRGTLAGEVRGLLPPPCQAPNSTLQGWVPRLAQILHVGQSTGEEQAGAHNPGTPHTRTEQPAT